MSIGNGEQRMLIIDLKFGEYLHVGDDIAIIAKPSNGEQVKLAINAPADIRILREELKQGRGGLSHKSVIKKPREFRGVRVDQ